MAIVRELKQAGAQSATFWVDTDGASVALRYVDWLTLPQGKLRDFLTGTYVDGAGVHDLTAMMQAFAAAGGSAVGTAAGGSGGVYLDITTSDSPEFGPVGTPQAWVLNPPSPHGVVVRLMTSYSASE
jgi:hypothetical protein